MLENTQNTAKQGLEFCILRVLEHKTAIRVDIQEKSLRVALRLKTV